MAKPTFNKFNRLHSPFNTKKAKEYADKMNKMLRKERRGGLRRKLSHCCRAPIVTRGKGGLVREVCQACGKTHHDRRYK